MINIFWVRITTILILLSFTVQAEKLELNPAIEKITKELLKQDYDQAERVIHRTPLDKTDSLFLEVLLAQARLADYESYAVDGRKFLILCDSARNSFRQIEEYKRPIRDMYYIAVMEGAAAVTRGKRRDIMGAITASNISEDNFDMVLKKDSSFTPIYFSVGMRRFYTASVFNKVGMGKKTIQSALQQMEMSVTDETIWAYSALPSLFWVYMDLEKYDKAEETARRFLKEYPDNTMMIRGLAKLHSVRKEYDAAEAVGNRLMTLSQKREKVNWSDYFAGSVAVVAAMRAQEKKVEAIDEINRLVAIELDKETEKLEWVKKHKKSLKSIKEELVAELRK